MKEYEVLEVVDPKLVKVDSDKLKGKIEALRKERNTIDEVLKKFSSDIGGMSEYWNGTTGDMVSEELMKYISGFDKIREQLDKYIEFLEDVSNTYEAFDKYVSNQIGYYT